MRNRLDYTRALLKAQKYITDGMMIFDAKKSEIPLVYVNKSVNKILNRTNKSIIGKSYGFLVETKNDQESIEKYFAIFQNAKKGNVVLSFRNKSDSIVYCRLAITPIPDKNKEIDFFVVIIRDITLAREKMLNKLKLSVVESTLHSVNDIVFNYLNSLQLFRMDIECFCGLENPKLVEFDVEYQKTLEKLKKINSLKEFKEVYLTEKFSTVYVS